MGLKALVLGPKCTPCTTALLAWVACPTERTGLHHPRSPGAQAGCRPLLASTSRPCSSHPQATAPQLAAHHRAPGRRHTGMALQRALA